MALGSHRPAAASYRRTASGRPAPGSAVRYRDSQPARKIKASSRLPETGLALMRRRAACSVAGSSREGVALVQYSRPRMSQEAGIGGRPAPKRGRRRRRVRGHRRRLPNDEEVGIAGFGTCGTRNRPARTGLSPRTGEADSISASTSPTFKVGKNGRGLSAHTRSELVLGRAL